MNSEPANFLNNGKAFPSMKWHAAASVLTSFSFFHDTGKPKGMASWDLQKPNLLENNPDNTRNNIKC